MAAVAWQAPVYTHLSHNPEFRDAAIVAIGVKDDFSQGTIPYPLPPPNQHNAV